MKKIIYFTLLVMTYFTNYSQVPTFNKVYDIYGEQSVDCLLETNDNSFLIGGWSNKAFLLKINKYGDTLWSKNYSMYNLHLYKIIAFSENSFLVIQKNNNIYYISKINENGDILWSKEINLFGYPLGIYKEANNDIFDIISSKGYSRIDQNGNTLFTKQYSINNCKSACMSKDSGIVYTGTKNLYYTNDSLFFFKATKSGDSLFTKYYNVGYGSILWSINQATNGYIAVGETDYFNAVYTKRKLLIVRFDENGDTLWTRKYNKFGNDWANFIVQTNDNNYFITANTAHIGEYPNFAWLLKIDDNGDTIWTKTYGTDTICTYAFSGIQLNDTGFLVSGIVEYSNTIYIGTPADIWALKVDENGNLLSSSNIFEKKNNIKIYPNPFTDFLFIDYKIDNTSYVNIALCDNIGNEIKIIQNNILQIPNLYSLKINLSNLNNGLYFFKIKKYTIKDNNYTNNVIKLIKL